MSANERDRLKVLHEVVQGHLKQKEGAEQLGMSERGFGKLLKRYREKSDAAVVHGLRGMRSNRRLADETAAKAVEAVRKEYRDFGPTLAAEYLRKDLSLKLSRETLRQLLIREGCGQRSRVESARSMYGGPGEAWPGRNSLRRKELGSPFPFPFRGKAGAGGFPPRRKKRGSSPQAGSAPLCIPLRWHEAHVADRNFLSCSV